MTAKEALLEQVSRMSETEATAAIKALPKGRGMSGRESPQGSPDEGASPLHPFLAQLFALAEAIPVGERPELPPVELIDEVVYRRRPVR